MQLTVRTSVQLGTILTARRKHLKLSQSEVAARIGISQNRFFEIESMPERILLDRLLALANLLDLEIIVQEKSDRAPVVSEW